MLAGPDLLLAPHPSYEFLAPADCDAADLDWSFRAARLLLAEPADAAIAAILRMIGEASGSDRAWMVEYGDDQTSIRNTFVECRCHAGPHVPDLQDASATMFAELHRPLAAGRAVMISRRTEGRPPTARPLQAEMRRQADPTILAVPIVHGGRLRAALGFETVHRRWPGAKVRALFRCAELVALVRYGRGAGAPDGPDRSPMIHLRGIRGTRGVEPDAIVCLRSARNRTDILLADGARVVDPRAFGLWSSLLPLARFVQVHRTAIVNLRHVRGVRRERDATCWFLEVRHLDQPLSVSRPYRAELKARLGL